MSVVVMRGGDVSVRGPSGEECLVLLHVCHSFAALSYAESSLWLRLDFSSLFKSQSFNVTCH